MARFPPERSVTRGTAVTGGTALICLQPAHAEHVRPMEDEDACDDFRAG